MSEVKENTAAATEESTELSAEEINSYKKIRMDKLAELQAEGRDPFKITKYDVTSSCAKARADYEACEADCKAKAGDDEEADPVT